MLFEVGEKMLVTCAGIFVFDMFATDLPRISPPGTLTFVPKEIEMHVGGHSANVSINLRRISLARREVSSVGPVGGDILGEYIKRTLQEEGVVTHLQRAQHAGTSKDLVLVVKGEDRRYHVDVGANLHLSPDFVLSVLSEETPLIFYVGGTGMLGAFDERLPQVLREAKGFSCLTFLDPVSPFRRGWDYLIRASQWIDILHCNDVEASDMTGHEDPRKAAGLLSEKGVGMVIISMGEKGLIARTRETTLEMPAFKVKVVDPSGAGDAFCAGVIYKLARTISEPSQISELSVEEICGILVEGAATGAACVTGVGTTAAVTRESVDRLLEQQGQEIHAKTRISTK